MCRTLRTFIGERDGRNRCIYEDGVFKPLKKPIS
ncbi:antitoxin family protein [Thermococcus sp.]